MHILLWVNVVLDFICKGFAELWWTGKERKNQNENLCLKWDLNQQTSTLSNANQAP